MHTHIIAPLGGDPEDVHNALNAFSADEFQF